MLISEQSTHGLFVVVVAKEKEGECILLLILVEIIIVFKFPQLCLIYGRFRHKTSVFEGTMAVAHDREELPCTVRCFGWLQYH
ncbi:unnamed protein product [Musa acuminata subsp. malaccensis]|uniref:(wild Malaysian banana) hypothetical protein n=1 Tax=Musa acuminata subsp. malaccensis TaxID=214687 RepID=A0A804JW07_MUSAM|nr:unnamed protein product [Musa acuminata subsp. malaccensis]